MTSVQPTPAIFQPPVNGVSEGIGPLKAGVAYVLIPMNRARKATQCKDIPDQPILDFLAALNGSVGIRFLGFETSVANAMPAGTPPNLVRAKMEMLIRRGVVDGCSCGCRGDYTITEKGAQHGLPTA